VILILQMMAYVLFFMKIRVRLMILAFKGGWAITLVTPIVSPRTPCNGGE
jgi:hypothetical protein